MQQEVRALRRDLSQRGKQLEQALDGRAQDGQELEMLRAQVQALLDKVGGDVQQLYCSTSVMLCSQCRGVLLTTCVTGACGSGCRAWRLAVRLGL